MDNAILIIAGDAIDTSLGKHRMMYEKMQKQKYITNT